MTDAKPAEPASAPASGTAETPEAGAAPKGERIGTILMVVAITGVVVLVLDVALKGRLLAPLFALLPAPKPKPTAEGPDAETRPAGE